MDKVLTKDNFSFKDVNSVEEAVTKLNYIIGLLVLCVGPLTLILGGVFSPTNLLSAVYYVLFGLMILSANMKIEMIEKHFKFLSNNYGRGIFTFYIGTIYFNIRLGALAFIAYIIFAVMTFIALYYIYQGFKASKKEQSDPSLDTIRWLFVEVW